MGQSSSGSKRARNSLSEKTSGYVWIAYLYAIEGEIEMPININISERVDRLIVAHSGEWLWDFEEFELYTRCMTQHTRVWKQAYLNRAKELGFIGKYRWGVEYATKGKKPEIDGHIEVEVVIVINGKRMSGSASDWTWPDKSQFAHITHFKIIDERYKPQDTRYLLAGVNMQEDKVPNKLENAAQELLDSLSDMTDEELSILGNAPEVQTLIELLKSQEAEKNIQKQALALYRSVNYNCELQDSVIMFSKRFDDYVKAIKDGWRKE